VPKVIILGGGLAGLVCAKALATAGLRVELWEASDRFGGKAGSTRVHDRWVDHGYHVIPKWYRNTNALLRELEVKLWLNKDFYEVQPRTVRDDPRGRPIKYSALSRTMIASLDLVSRPPWYLDELSVDAFLRGRLYAGRTSGDRLREISRKALGSPAYLTSSLTMQSNLRWWMRVFRQENWNALKGPMQTTLIDPLERAASDAGAELCHRRVSSIELRGDRMVPLAPDREQSSDDEDAIVVSALPVEVLKELARHHPRVVEELIERRSKLLDLQYLETTPLSAVDLHLVRRVDNLPLAHFILRYSRYDVTGLDITNVWDEYRSNPEHPTVLQLVAGDTTRIRSLPEEEFTNAVIDDVCRFLPFGRSDVDREHTTAMTHVSEPLFANDVGSNSRRVAPAPKDVRTTGVRNLYIIGDHADTEVDLACMEGAIYSALAASRRICEEANLPPPPLLPLEGIPPSLIWLLKVVRYPLGLLALPFRVADLHTWGRALRDWRALDDEVLTERAVSAERRG
jgi:hypothetical protein